MLSILLDWFPLVSFFIAFKLHGIYFATKVIIIASICQILISKFILKNKIEPVNWAIFGLVVAMGSLTLFFHNEAYIKWKPTILYIAFALAFIISPMIKNNNLVELMLTSKVKLEANSWRTLNYYFIIFFLIMAALNTYVFMHYSTAIWVNYKLFGTFLMTLIFMLGISYFIIKNKINE